MNGRKLGNTISSGVHFSLEGEVLFCRLAPTIAFKYKKETIVEEEL